MSSTQQYWPSIKETIDINNDPSQPNSTSQVQCPVCLEAIAVTSFPPIPDRQGDTPSIDPTLGQVLLCGHVLCQACRVQHDLTNRYQKRTCPMCRTSLECSDCGRPAVVVPIPKEGSPSSVPAIVSEGAEHGGRCADCNSCRWFDENIQQGEWPEGLADLEPGFVPFFYHVVRKLEQEKRFVTQETIISAFATIVRHEFTDMLMKRRDAIYQRSAATSGQNPWFRNVPLAPEVVDPVSQLAEQIQPRQRTTPRIEGGEALGASSLPQRLRLQLDQIYEEQHPSEDEDGVDLVSFPYHYQPDDDADSLRGIGPFIAEFRDDDSGVSQR